MRRPRPSPHPGSRAGQGALLQVDLAVVTDHEPGRVRPATRPDDLDVVAQKGVLKPARADYPAVVEDHRMFDLTGVDHAAPPYGGERPHERVRHGGVLPHYRRTPDVAAHHPGAPLQDH